MDYHLSIREAYPDALLVIEGETADDLKVINQETGEDFVFDQTLIETAWNQIVARRNTTQYQRNRQPEYPSLADLADALYWSNQGDNTKLDEYYTKVSAVKTKYPKPEAS